MKQLAPRKRMIMDHLLMQDGWTTSTQLAMQLNVSDRTIRKEISHLACDLMPYGLSIVSERGKGYSIKNSDKVRLDKLLYIDNAFFSDEENFPPYVNILLFLLGSKGYMDIDDLCDRFYYSHAAIESEIKIIRDYLKRYSNRVKIDRRKNAIRVEGSEKEKRLIINSFIVSYAHSNLSIGLKAYTTYFKYEDLLYCNNSICEIVKEYDDLKITDIGIVAIIIHTMIAIQRIQQGFALDQSYIDEDQSASSDDNLELDMANKLWDSMETHFRLSANAYEREATAYLISFRRVFFAEGMTIEDLDKGPAKEYLQLTRTIVAELRDIYLLDLTQDKDLLVGLTAHLKSLADRVNLKSHYANPILMDFKDKYPFIFELAIYARQRIRELKDLVIDEDEVGYLAIHFGASVERLKRLDAQDRIRTALVCHAGYSNSQFLIAKLESVFGDKLAISGPYSSFDKKAFVEDMPQLILSTTDLDAPFDIPCIVINLLLDRSDIQQIGNYIEKGDNTNSNIERMRQFFREDYFFPQLPYKNPDEIINFLSEKLINSGRVWPSFKKLVFERESFSPTVIQNAIALPHPFTFCSYETTISVATLPRAIDWHGRKVQMIFLMAIKKGDQQYLKDFFEFIVDLSEDANRVQMLVKVRDLDTFWQFLLGNKMKRKNGGD